MVKSVLFYYKFVFEMFPSLCFFVIYSLNICQNYILKKKKNSQNFKTISLLKDRISNKEVKFKRSERRSGKYNKSRLIFFKNENNLTFGQKLKIDQQIK